MVTDITTKDYIPTGVHEIDIKLGETEKTTDGMSQSN